MRHITTLEWYYVGRFAIWAVLLVAAGVRVLWERTPWVRRREAQREAESKARTRALVRKYMIGGKQDGTDK